MELTSINDLKLIMLIGMFLLGSAAFITGVITLISGIWGRDVRSITTQTTRLAQKGLAEELSGLVGNASTLLNTINDMIRTATGVGVFLTISGALIMGVSCWFIINLS
jgi:hypothetical protein